MDETTLLFYSIEEGDEEKFRDLINTVDINTLDESGDNLLHAAAAYGQDEFAKELIDRDIDINHRGKEGKTPLHYALEMGYEDMVRILLSEGADVTVTDDYGNQPLWSAVVNEETKDDIIQSLVAHGADPANQNDAGKSPRSIARRRDDQALIEIFTD
ncbi:ankyrin repeat-containing protein [Halogeometricum borinquense DSM 11551]|uniref:Ankyrin repeat-containing protein n=1 Tax=Halogeometricum borinquense (strain ATCC 700274 / DSM 11551 / JCM 10706 / KCTC 4070 / PR3) TaxID=469382 RepID=E4NKW6_HALBP|nr:ankyrin repeat domain-containing protein [Halogeometricum borinquense]ADQ66012.1 ankyrin repeat-containing protein [Halogeometricum borinquense DSM 11551]ELY27491.1 ankyrin repeat-containing protein [Halogeometricum borinquense DSM 11551]